jgi:FkbM family methyltransferase
VNEAERSQLAAENVALRAQLAAVGAELAHAREDSIALRAQLAAVGKELAHARTQISEMKLDRRESASERERAYVERRNLILLPRLLDLLDPGERFVVVDAGAREVDRDPRWRPFPAGRLTFIGFEPDEEEAARLNAAPVASGLQRKFVAAGLWGSSGVEQFEHNNIGGGSSFLSQNRPVTDRWKFENPTQATNARDIFFPLRREPIKVTSLADWAKAASIAEIDFLKLNVQGAEQEILIGAGPMLDGILGILIEVSFVESYHQRPLFSDIDPLLRSHGFCFFDLLAHHYVGRSAAPVVAQHLRVANGQLGQLVSGWGQLIEGHALYLRDPMDRKKPLDFERTIKLAALAEAFGQVELAFELLVWLGAHPNIGERGAQLRHLLHAAEADYAGLAKGCS